MKQQPDEDQDSSVDVHAQNTAGQDRAQEMLPRPSGEEWPRQKINIKEGRNGREYAANGHAVDQQYI